jgi:O-antigen/teichoic acid export membrane protein
MMNSLSRLALPALESLHHDFFWRFGQILSKEGISFYIFVVAALLLTPYDLGIYSYLMVWIFLIITLGDFGFSSAVTRAVAQWSILEPGREKRIIYNVGLLIVCGSVLLCIGIVAVTTFWFPQYLTYAWVMCAIALCAPLTALYDGVYRGTGRFKTLCILTVICSVAMIPIAAVLISTAGILGALVAQAMFSSLILIAQVYGYRDGDLRFDRILIKDIVSYSAILGITALAYFLYNRLLVFALGHYGFVTEIGVVELFNKIFMLCLLPFTIFAQVIATKITLLQSQAQHSVVQVAYMQSMVSALLVGTVIALLLYVTLPLLISTFLPHLAQFESTHYLTLMLPVFVTQAVSAIAATGFSTARGHGHINLLFLAVFTIINIIGIMTFAPSHGFWAIVAMSAVVKIASDVLFVFYYYRKLY